ncbi:MAG TPA: GntR family transcriptional regulator [Nocardia sp.]|uniref:GntR family transcriptional regulator n=1 Tax=Nocardia TaxID=1817 RepID=UPI0024540CDB|nr:MULTISPECIES: GntR family transcriptional regulator [Nocardia]HLS76750.1 GntR family transcriptional regulator [Nocardia sp.]
MGADTVVADVADELARRVAAGQYRPGELMPSVRQVAEEFEMNRATAQLTLGRLESYGFVSARRGKGFTIHDVRAVGGLEVYRHLFRFSLDRPDLAVAMFGDIVAAERELVREALLGYTASERAVDRAELAAMVAELETLARQQPPDHRRVLAAEVALIRRLFTAMDTSLRRAVFNSVAEMVLEVPEAVRAYFAAPAELHALMWRALLSVWDSGTPPSPAQSALFDELFDNYHRRVLARFRELVAGGAATAPVTTAPVTTAPVAPAARAATG